MQNNNELATNLRALRAARGFTQSEVARRAGISQVMLSKYERGVAAPNLHRIDLLANALGVTTPQLIANVITTF